MSFPHEGASIALVVRFPDVYPYMRFEVQAAELNLDRHQNPFAKHLCLLGRSTEFWAVDDTVAGVLSQQLPKLLRAGGPHEGEELPQGEPFSDYYAYAPNSALVVDGAWQIKSDVKRGKFEASLDRAKFPFRGAVLKVLDNQGNILVEADPAIRASLFKTRVTGRWIRLDQPIHQEGPREVFREIRARYPDLSLELPRARRGNGPDIIGVLFPEEVALKTFEDGWLFFVRAETDIGLVRGTRGGRKDVAARAPEVKPLHDSTISVIGLGSIGAPAALEFARAGVKALRMVDADFVDLATTVRWPLGYASAGKDKTTALGDFVRANFPYCEVKQVPVMVGAALPQRDYSDRNDLEEILNADLIFDATAEIGIQQLLSDMAIELGKPYMAVSTTPGAWGGRIFRIRPGVTKGCFSCLMHSFSDGTISLPPARDEQAIQVAGCASPTFTGAGFDCSLISLNAVRIAVGTLCAQAGYPDNDDDDVFIVSLRSDDGTKAANNVASYALDRHPECRNPLHGNNLDRS